jgi:hypothetical protein
MGRKSQRREAIEGWKEWEHDQLPLQRFEVHEHFQVANIYVVEARSEEEACEMIEQHFYRDAGLQPVSTTRKGKHHHVSANLAEG